MSPTDELIPILKKLRLSGVLESLELRIQQAVEDELSHSEFLLRLLQDEADRRDANQLSRRLKRAAFEHERTLETFDFAFNDKLPKAKVLELANISFVERADNVLLIGPTGVGKSHLAQALGHRACRAGYDVLHVTADDMLRQLRAARADGSHEKRLQRFVRPPLLILDDIGLRALTGDEPLDLYDVIRLRYEKRSTILTSNRDVPEIGALFGDPLLAGAAMDRLLHHAHVLTLVGNSFRNPPQNAKRGRRKKAA